MLQKAFPFQPHFPPKAKCPISSLELFRVVLPFPAEEKTEYEQKRKKKKITAMKRKVMERDRLGMKLVAGGGGVGRDGCCFPTQAGLGEPTVKSLPQSELGQIF